MNEDIIIMKRKDAERLRVIQKVIDKHLNRVEAGEILLAPCKSHLAPLFQRGAGGIIGRPCLLSYNTPR